MKLEDYLRIDADRYPDKTAVVCRNKALTYRELYQKVLKRTEALLRSDVTGGKVIAVRTSQSIEFLIDYFALHLSGFVVAPLEKNMPDELFDKIASEMTAYSVPSDIADILYTTGTTGKSKGVMISHKAIMANAENLIEAHEYTPDLVFVISGPLNHIGNLSKIYPLIVVGGTIVITEGIKDINDFFEAFNYPAEKFATFLVPASIRILLQFSADRLANISEKIDFIETGAAAISSEDMKKLCKILPYSRLYNTYASTETGIISTYNYNDGECVAGCLGKTMKHSKVMIDNASHIICKGDTVMSGYIGDEEQTRRVLHNNTISTSDIGHIDEQGMLHLMGREDDVINVGGYKISPTEVEDIAMSHPYVQDCICIAVSHKITGLALKLLVVTSDESLFNKRELASFLKSKLEQYKVPLLYETVAQIKRTFNGKLDRKYYAH